jgi:aminoglycoside phosphotransferase (APT) family kinase protein
MGPFADNVDVGPLLGRGRTADVFALGDRHVVKLFHPDRPAGAIARERSISETLNTLDVPAPAFAGEVKIGGRTGIIYEWIRGPSMLAEIMHRPWRVGVLARRLAELHYRLHGRRATDLPPLRSYLEQMIGRASQLPEATRAAALAQLGRLSDGDRLCHGDFHPDNVLLTERGPVVLDWMTATRGVPAADVQRTLLLLDHAVPPPGLSQTMLLLLQVVRRLISRAYWRRYAALSGVRSSDLDAWKLPLLAARLGEGIPAVERELVLRLLEAGG